MTTGHHSRKILSKAEGNVTRKRRTQKRNQGTGVRSEKDRKETASMPRMIERIAHPANLETACRKVKANKGSAGVDGMGVEELSEYMEAHKEEISNVVC